MPKTKIYACKSCSHKTEKKEDHWAHMRLHLDPKKLKSCKSCPFVTELKHHLEYHYKNHAGVKPYKCDNCDYQCVNKSMLKSHMKSHSPECPYRCSSCKYSTKYAHSLKMHSKKYHQNQHHERLVIDVFTPKSENSNEASKDGSNSISPNSTVTTISNTTTNDTIMPTTLASHCTASTTFSDMNCILDLRIKSKLKSG